MRHRNASFLKLYMILAVHERDFDFLSVNAHSAFYHTHYLGFLLKPHDSSLGPKRVYFPIYLKSSKIYTVHLYTE